MQMQHIHRRSAAIWSFLRRHTDVGQVQVPGSGRGAAARELASPIRSGKPMDNIPAGCDYRQLQSGVPAFPVTQLSDSDCQQLASALPSICMCAQHLLSMATAHAPLASSDLPQMSRWVPSGYSPCSEMLQAGVVPVRNPYDC
jgi:hypothetical protein